MSNGIFGGNIFKQPDSPFVNPPARRLTAAAASGLGDAGVLTGSIFEQADSPFMNPPSQHLSARAASGFGIFDGANQDWPVSVDVGQPRIITPRRLPPVGVPMAGYYLLPPSRVPMRGMGGCGCR